ncbi:PRP39 factor, partial [Semnornis frantzii]|nr:PRP39 factor [Semnornis frantzii]
ITEIENMRHRIIEIHQEMFNHNEHEVSKRWTFEEAVSRGLLCKAGDERALNINPGARNWRSSREQDVGWSVSIFQSEEVLAISLQKMLPWFRGLPPWLLLEHHGYSLGQVVQAGCGFPLPVYVQGPIGHGLEQPGLVGGVPAHGRGVGIFKVLSILLTCCHQPHTSQGSSTVGDAQIRWSLVENEDVSEGRLGSGNMKLQMITWENDKTVDVLGKMCGETGCPLVPVQNQYKFCQSSVSATGCPEFFQPGAKETEGRPLALYNSLSGYWSQVGVGPVSQRTSVWAREDGLRLHQGKFSWDRMNKFFPQSIKRPYFHVKPLEKIQLKNWKEYLEFEIENGTHERVVVLFERCVISCALYEDFWIKYAKYMENHSIEGVRHVYSRACTIHLPKKPMVHMLWAAFEEQQGNIDEARRILKSFEECVLGLAMIRLRRVSLERRHGNMEEAEHLLEEAMRNAKSMTESSFYAIKLARHLFKVQKNLPKARKVLSEAIEMDKENTKLYLNLLEMEYSGDLKQNEENILSCFDKAVNGALSIKMRITFSQRKVEFLEDFGSDVNKLLDAYDEHQALLKEQDSLKRRAENGSEEPDEKKMLTDDPALASAQMMDGDMQVNQAAYNYNAWYQYNYQNAWNYGQYYHPT